MPTDRPINASLVTHAILALFSIAYLDAALLTDLAYVHTLDLQWSNFSIWLITGGLLVAVAAVVAGIVAFFTGPQVRSWQARLYIVAYAVALTLGILNAFVHSRDGYTAVVPEGVTLSAIVVVLSVIAVGAGVAVIDRRGWWSK